MRIIETAGTNGILKSFKDETSTDEFENHTHLDFYFKEKHEQNHIKENAAENLACLRHMSLNMLQAEPTRASISMKQKRCWMKTKELEKVLIAGIAKQVN
jgi:hypothetical protein